MKHILKYNESTSSVEHLLPGDGSYKRIGHSDYEKIEYAFSYVSTTESENFITDSLQSLYDKLSTIEGCHARLRHNSVTYETNLFSGVFVDIKLRAEDWYIINIQLRNDVVILIADGEFGVQQFIEDFDPNNPYMKSNPLNESINFPDDEGYVEIDHEDFKQFVDQYPTDNTSFKMKDLHDIVYKKMKLLDLNPLSNTDQDHHFDITLSTRSDEWILILLAIKRKDLRYILCDGVEGLVNFMNDFDPRSYSNSVNEAISYPGDGSFSKLDYNTSYSEFLLQYDQKLDREMTNKCLDLLHNYFFKKNLPVIKHRDTIQVESDEYVNSVSVSPYSDGWILVNSYQGSFLCDQIEGFEAFINSDILMSDPEANPVNESVEDDIEEDSYDEATLEDYIYMWKRYKPCDFEAYELEELKDALEAKLSINVFPEKEFTLSLYSRSERVLFTVNKMNDGWILVKTDDDAYYVCDQVAGLIKFMDV